MAGVSLPPAETHLTARARVLLASGPADVVSLVEYVCQLPGAPRAVAEHLAAVLFAGRSEFVRTVNGHWSLSGADPAAPVAVAACDDSDVCLRRPYVVVDVETTGGRPDHGDRITEIAAVVVRDGEVAEVFETLVNPERAIPPWITHLTNISWDMVRDKPTFRDICGDVLRAMEGRVFVAHNATFDWKFVSAEVERATGQRLEGQRLCTVRLARKLLPQLPRRSLDYVTAHYGIAIAARHRAAGDAVATAHVLLRLLRDARDRGVERWPDLERLLGARSVRGTRRRPRAMPHPVDRDTTA